MMAAIVTMLMAFLASLLPESVPTQELLDRFVDLQGLRSIEAAVATAGDGVQLVRHAGVIQCRV